MRVKMKNKYEVRVKQLKLELGVFGGKVKVVGAGNESFAVEIIGKSCCSNTTKRLPIPFYQTSKRPSTYTTHPTTLNKSGAIVWDARDLCDFHLLVNVKDASIAACDMAFHVLYGQGSAQSNNKLALIGKASVNITMAELLVREDLNAVTDSKSQLQRKLPIDLKLNGLSIQATLWVRVRLVEVGNCEDSKPGEGGKYFPRLKWNKKKQEKSDGREEAQQGVEVSPSPYDSDHSPVFDSDQSWNESGSSDSSCRISNAEAEGGLERVKRSRSMLHLNRSSRGWSFGTSTRNQDPFTSHSPPFKKSELDDNFQVKELMSRDGEAKLKTNVFFGSFDQRSEEACGESACTALVALIAHWLHSNKQNMPTTSQLDGLITQGSSEWRKLCNTDACLKRFPDKHFDLETVIEANLRPLTLVPHKSYTAFFSPEKFECLKGAMSFDEIWNEINSNLVHHPHHPRVYIVSWNDHFFVLKVEAGAYYIIDSLGERLLEGCQQAYILKFDHSSSMYVKLDKADKEESLKLVCSGKECCKEFIKRFLAAIPLRQLEEEDKKGNHSNPYLHRLLQIDFHYTSSLGNL